MGVMTASDQDPLAPSTARDDIEDRAERLDLELQAPDGAEAADAEPELPSEQPAVLRRVPRIEVFLGLGAILGLLLALGLAYFWPDQPVPMGERQYSDGQVFGFLALFLVPAVIGLLGLIGSLLGRSKGEPVLLRREDADEPLHVTDPDAAASAPAGDAADLGRAER